MNRLYRILAYGYFPKELPPIFSTRSFASTTFRLNNTDAYVGNTWQRSCPYLLQQKTHYRRKLDILCPNAFYKQADLVTSNYEELRRIFSQSTGNSSRPVFNRQATSLRAVGPCSIGRAYAYQKLELRSRFPIILKLDIKNYYRSIYTHSIPWAIHGKEYAKTHLREDNLGNRLDKAFQLGQDGQTIGIPTGPDTSFIISEVILSRVMAEMIDRSFIRGDRFVRYYDDIEYGCESEEEAYRVLALFEDILRNYELEVNPDKIKMFSGPQYMDKPWLFRIRDLSWQEGIKVEPLMEVFSFVSELAQQYPHDHVFRYFLRKMRSSIVAEEAWDSYQRILLSAFQENRGNAKEVFDQFIYYQLIGWQINERALKESLDRKVMQQLTRGATSELSWAIYGYILFNLNIGRELAQRILERGDVPSKVLVTKLIFDHNLSTKSELNTIIRSWGEDVLNSSEWLFAYEVLINAWHNRYVQIPLPANRALYEVMIDNNVSFLDESKLASIHLPSIFERHAPRMPERPYEEGGDSSFVISESESTSSAQDAAVVISTDYPPT